MEKNDNTKVTNDIMKDILKGKEYVKELREKSFTTVKHEHEIFFSELYNIDEDITNYKKMWIKYNVKSFKEVGEEQIIHGYM